MNDSFFYPCVTHCSLHWVRVRDGHGPEKMAVWGSSWLPTNQKPSKPFLKNEPVFLKYVPGKRVDQTFSPAPFLVPSLPLYFVLPPPPSSTINKQQARSCTRVLSLASLCHPGPSLSPPPLPAAPFSIFCRCIKRQGVLMQSRKHHRGNKIILQCVQTCLIGTSQHRFSARSEFCVCYFLNTLEMFI